MANANQLSAPLNPNPIVELGIAIAPPPAAANPVAAPAQRSLWQRVSTGAGRAIASQLLRAELNLRDGAKVAAYTLGGIGAWALTLKLWKNDTSALPTTLDLGGPIALLTLAAACMAIHTIAPRRRDIL
jgi:hypothetical protein